MKPILSILACISFVIAGHFLASANQNASYGYKTMSAATLPVYSQDTNPIAYPKLPIIPSPECGSTSSQESELTSDFKESLLIDSLYKEIDHLAAQEPVVKVKWKQAPAPDPIVIRDTVSIYYLARQVGSRDDPDNCIEIYELQQVDEICPK